MSDCDTCMKRHDLQRRRAMRCGLEPLVELSPTGARARTFVPKYLQNDISTLDVCPVYSTSLAEVEEVRQVYPAFKAGYAAELLGERPSPDMIAACIVLDNAVNARDAQRMKDAQEARNGST